MNRRSTVVIVALVSDYGIYLIFITLLVVIFQMLPCIRLFSAEPMIAVDAIKDRGVSDARISGV